MPQLDRDGVKIYYEVHGRGDPVILSHGYSATSKMWAKQVEALDDSYRVITWDMRGHGSATVPTISRATPRRRPSTTWRRCST